MSSYELVKHKTEEESDNEEVLLSQTSTKIDGSDGHNRDSTWKQGRQRLRRWRLTEIGLVLFILLSNLSWFLSSRIWAQPMLKDPDYCEYAVACSIFTKLIIISI